MDPFNKLSRNVDYLDNDDGFIATITFIIRKMDT